MTAEQQLERSVLESKERDELHAIAQALSVKTTTRTKKADIIDGILQAAGVPTSDGGANGGGDAPASNEAPRSRSRRTRSAKAETFWDMAAMTGSEVVKSARSKGRDEYTSA